MKNLVTTAAALREIAAGLNDEAVRVSAALYQSTTEECDFLISVHDELDSPLIFVERSRFTRQEYVPDELIPYRRETIGRMASFVERSQQKPLSLPRGWHQYKHNNFIAFFACSSSDPGSARWIAEVNNSAGFSVVFWRTTTARDQESLREFEESRNSSVPNLQDLWIDVYQQAVDHFEMASRQPSGSDVEMVLPVLAPTAAKNWTYEQWMTSISPDQRAFVDASTAKSIRLRGPAGSGKSVALGLKAVSEVLAARKDGTPCRVILVTHSWQLASELSSFIDSLGLGPFGEIDVLPLLSVAEEVLPKEYVESAAYTLAGDDSLSGKQAQLDEIKDVIDDFRRGDWITYRADVSDQLRQRVDSQDERERQALRWDLLIEFGSVIGAAGIFPGAGSELKYEQLPRSSWMLPVGSKRDLRAVFSLYSNFVSSLESRGKVTSDQVLADFVSYLESHAWNRRRKVDGFDLIFVDEFHLFSPLERQVLHYLTRDVEQYPRIFLAADPRQSPSSAFLDDDAEQPRTNSGSSADENLGELKDYDLVTIHRYSRQILDAIKHVHLFFPTLSLGQEWDVDFSQTSASKDGPVPSLITSGGRVAEETDISKAVAEVYGHGRVALAVVDERQWSRFAALAALLKRGRSTQVTTLTSRGELEALQYRSRGLVVAPAEYLAGLQFPTVLVAGIPEMSRGVMVPSQRSRILSLLYLAISRAEHEVRIFVNEDDGGAPEVLERGVGAKVLTSVRGADV